MMKSLLAAALILVGCATAALAAGEGKAVGVKPEAVGKRGAAERVLVVGADVSVGDRIVTGASGHVQLLFADQTRLVVGPRSTLEIEAYLLNGSRNDAFAVNALAGTFRFISGNSPKSVYSIDTPTASIAVRGTKFDLTVAGSNARALLFEGALSLCRGATCIELNNRCDIASVGSVNGLFTLRDDRNGLTGNFPLPNIQSAFLPDFRVQGAQACLAPPSAQPAGSDSNSSSGGNNSSPPPTGQYTAPTGTNSNCTPGVYITGC